MPNIAGGLLAIFLVVAGVEVAFAATVRVDAVGQHGWDSGDTRASGYLDIHGDTQVVSGRNQVEEALIADRIALTAAPGGPPLANGALQLRTFAMDEKATLELSDWNAPFDGILMIEYASLRESGAPPVAHPAIKVGIDTSEANGTSDLAVDRGEHRFDKILVYEPYLNHVTFDDVWVVDTLTRSAGLFWLVNLNPISSLPSGGIGDLRTLDEWNTEFSAAGLGGATATSLQVGIGSGNPELSAYVDYVTYTSAGQGGTTTTWDFDAAGIPVSSSSGSLGVVLATLLGLLGIGILSRNGSLPA